MCGTSAPLRPLCFLFSQARGRARASQSMYSFVAAQGSRELRRELTNEALETLMERAVAAVQAMDQAEYQAKVCGQPEYPEGTEAEDALPGRSLATRTYTPWVPVPLGANLAHLGKVEAGGRAAREGSGCSPKCLGSRPYPWL